MSATDMVDGWSSASLYVASPMFDLPVDVVERGVGVHQAFLDRARHGDDLVGGAGFVHRGDGAVRLGRGGETHRLGVGGAVGRRHGEDVAGLHVDHDRDTALGARVADALHQCLLGVPLQRLVDGEHQVVAALRRVHLALATGDLVALRVALHLRLARGAGHRRVEAVLESTETGVVGADEAEHRRREIARRVEALRLRGVGEAVEAELLHLLHRGVVDLAGHVGERAVRDRRDGPSSACWPAASRCSTGASFAAYTSGSLTTRGSAEIVVCGTDKREGAAGAVEDRAALGGEHDGAHPLAVARGSRGARCRGSATGRAARRSRRRRRPWRRAVRSGAAGPAPDRPARWHAAWNGRGRPVPPPDRTSGAAVARAGAAAAGGLDARRARARGARTRVRAGGVGTGRSTSRRSS